VVPREKSEAEAEEKVMTVRLLADAKGRVWLLFATFLEKGMVEVREKKRKGLFLLLYSCARQNETR